MLRLGGASPVVRYSRHCWNIRTLHSNRWRLCVPARCSCQRARISRGSKNPSSGKPPSVEQLFRPRAQRSTKPRFDRHGKALLWPIDERRRHVPVQESAQEPLVLSGLAILDRRRKAPDIFGDAVVEQRHTDFQAECHACPIHLGENAVRQACHHAEVTHALKEVGEGGAQSAVLKQVRPLARARNDGGRVLGRAHQAAIDSSSPAAAKASANSTGRTMRVQQKRGWSEQLRPPDRTRKAGKVARALRTHGQVSPASAIACAFVDSGTPEHYVAAVPDMEPR